MTSPARFGDFATLPLPDQRVWFNLDMDLNSVEEERVRRGLVPKSTDDRWFLFVEDDQLYCHRSWTGAAIFGVHIESHRDSARLTRAWASRDAEQYNSGGMDEDMDLLANIVTHLLIDRR